MPAPRAKDYSPFQCMPVVAQTCGKQLTAAPSDQALASSDGLCGSLIPSDPLPVSWGSSWLGQLRHCSATRTDRLVAPGGPCKAAAGMSFYMFLLV